VSGDTAAVVATGFVTVAFMVGALVMFGYFLSRRRVFTRGVRGTALVVDVRPVGTMRRYSATEAATDDVTAATAARPQGVLVDQKPPAGQYQVGQVVPVVQAQGPTDKMFLDRPDLERSLVGTYAPLALVVAAPLFAVLGLHQLAG